MSWAVLEDWKECASSGGPLVTSRHEVSTGQDFSYHGNQMKAVGSYLAIWTGVSNLYRPESLAVPDPSCPADDLVRNERKTTSWGDSGTGRARVLPDAVIP